MESVLQNNNKNIRSIFSKVMMIVAASMSCFHIFTAAIGSLPTMEQRSIHLCFTLVLIFMKCIVKREGSFGFRDLIDSAFIIIGAVSTLYVYFLWEPMFMRAPFPEVIDIVIGTLVVIAVLEGTRRELGKAIPILGIIFILYALYGKMIPIREIAHRGFLSRESLQILPSFRRNLWPGPGFFSNVYFPVRSVWCFSWHSGASQFFVDLRLHFSENQGESCQSRYCCQRLFGMVSEVP